MTSLFSIEMSLATSVQSEVLEEWLALCVTEARFLEMKFPIYPTCLQIPSAFMVSCVWALLSQGELPLDVYYGML